MEDGAMRAVLPVTTKTAFLSALTETGNVSDACRRTGVNRATAYHWRRDPEFDRMWSDALVIRRDAIRDELVSKAMAATGRMVETPAVDPDTGEPLLDDEFEPVMERRLVDYDGQVLRTMLNKFVRSEDGPSSASVSVSATLSVEAPGMPRLVRPEEAQDAEFEEVDDVDA
jgi:hypothetical protein